MSKLIVTSSNNINILDTNVIVDLCAGVFLIDLKSSTFIGEGANAVLGAKIRITNPYDVAIKDYTNSYDILPPFQSVFSFNISTSGGNYEYGEFIIDVQVTDSDNKIYTVTKKVSPCYPDSENKNRKYASLGASIKGICKEGRVLVSVNSLPAYNGLLKSSVIQSFDFEYPTGSGLPKVTRTISYFSDYLFEGVYKLEGDICASYNADDNIVYKVPFKVSASKEIFCQIDECAVFAGFDSLHSQLDAACNEEDRTEIGNKILEAVFNLVTAKSANDCGEDASDYIKRLQELLSCKCTCDFGTAPISNLTPSRDVVIDGCNITSENNGLTTHYIINNYSYSVEQSATDNFISVSSPQLTDCSYKQIISLDIAKVYTQIKADANSSVDEANFWASVVNKAALGVKAPTNIDQSAWDAMSYAQRLQAIINSIPAPVTIPAPPDVPPTPTFINGTQVLVGRDGTTPAKVGLGSPLTQDTTIAGYYRLAFTQARVGIGMTPVFPLDIFLNDSNFNLAAQITSQLVLQNGKSRIGLLSAMQIFGGSFTASSVDQVSGKTGQLTFYNTGVHVLNAGASYSGNVGILIGYSTGSVTGSVVSALATICNFGKTGNYDEAAGLRVNTPVGNGFIDASAFSGTINDFYYIELEAFNPASWSGTILRRWGIFQKGNDPHKFGGKIVWDATQNAGTGNVTINKPAGWFMIAAGQTSAVVTNNMVTVNSMVWVQLGTIQSVGDAVPTAVNDNPVAIENNGFFTVFLRAAQTIPVKIKFIVYN